MTIQAPARDDWTIPHIPEHDSGWLLYSESFILQSVQGCFGHPERIRCTPIWRLAAVALKLCLACAQAMVMLISKIPILHYIVGAVARNSGRNMLGFFLRGAYWKARLRFLGEDTLIDQGVDFWGADRISIGHGCMIGSYVHLSAGSTASQAGIIIGDHVFIGPFAILAGGDRITIGRAATIAASAKLYTSTNIPLDMLRPDLLLAMGHAAPFESQKVNHGPIHMDDFSFVGVGSIVLPNASLGLGAMVHPYAEVSGTFDDFANISGHGRARQNGWRRPLTRTSTARAA